LHQNNSGVAGFFLKRKTPTRRIEPNYDKSIFSHHRRDAGFRVCHPVTRGSRIERNGTMPAGASAFRWMRLGPEKNIERVKESSKHATLLRGSHGDFLFHRNAHVPLLRCSSIRRRRKIRLKEFRFRPEQKY
jgi:hypothetical protein